MNASVIASPPDMLNEVYRLAAAGLTDEAGDLIFRTVDEWCRSGDFAPLSDMLQDVDLDRLDAKLVYALLSVSHPAKPEISGWPEFVERACARMRALALPPERVNGVMLRFARAELLPRSFATKMIRRMGGCGCGAWIVLDLGRVTLYGFGGHLILPRSTFPPDSNAIEREVDRAIRNGIGWLPCVQHTVTEESIQAAISDRAYDVYTHDLSERMCILHWKQWARAFSGVLEATLPSDADPRSRAAIPVLAGDADASTALPGATEAAREAEAARVKAAREAALSDGLPVIEGARRLCISHEAWAAMLAIEAVALAEQGDVYDAARCAGKAATYAAGSAHIRAVVGRPFANVRNILIRGWNHE